jgi:capsular exopolysaccharide synthesis family protein
MTPVQILQLAAEADSQIVERVFLADESPKKAIVFTGPDRHNGCSWIVARIAQTLAKRTSGSVCVVDANLRHPSLHNLFCLDNSRGFLQGLQETEPIRSYAQQMQNTNLWVLPSGGLIADTRELLSPDIVNARIEEIAREFDFVLIDTASVKTASDASIIGRFADGVVLVLAANATTRESAVNCKLTLEAAQASVAGAVLNKRTYPIPDKIFQYL